MYPSSTSSSSQGSMSHTSSNTGGGGGLTRYGSAPGSFLTTAVESVIAANNHEFTPHGSHHQHPHLGPSRYYAESTSNNNSNKGKEQQSSLQRSFGFNDLTIGSGGGGGGGGVMATTTNAPLVRHSSSPARFLNQLATAAADNAAGIGILGLLFLKSLGLVVGLGGSFFRRPGYLLDGLVVMVALLLETYLEKKGGGLLVVVSLWRVVRVIESAFELSDEAIEAQIEQIVSQFDELKEENKRLMDSIVEKDKEIEKLQEDIDWYKNQLSDGETMVIRSLVLHQESKH